MDPKNSKIFSKNMMQTVSAFCESQEIKDVDNFMYLCFKQGFDIRKYGFLEKTLNEGEKDLKTGGIGEKQVEIEVIVEKRVEVPVEVIKEVEKIVEVIKEIPIDRVVEKEVYITDDTQVNELLLKIQELENGMSKKNEELDELRQEISTKTTENESFFQNEMSKKNEELDELRRTLDELRQTLDEKNNNDKTKLLQETLQNLRGELQQKNEQIKELDKINRDLLNGDQNQAYLLRGSNLNRRI